jgi:hypothetical protein
MVGTQGLLAIAMSFLLAGIPGGSKPEVLGIIVVAEGASLSGGSASEGTSVYNGDRLSTEAGGALQLRSGGVALALSGASSVVVRNNAGGAGKEFEVELASGTITLSAAAEAAAEIQALGARIRRGADGRVIVQVRILGPKELMVSARRGSVLVCYGGENEMISEGRSYRVILDPPEGGTTADQNAKKPGKESKAFLLIAIIVATAITVPFVHAQFESPDRP